MSQPADETRLGELLVTTGKLSSEELLAALEAQRQQGGPQRKRLGEILVERGHITDLDIQETLCLAPRAQAQEVAPTVTPGNLAADADRLPPEVQRAMADPSRRVGRYVLLSVLGRGGMGVVYRGYDPMLRREVAIKTILADRAADRDGLARFMREAQACAKLRHPCIIAVHEVGEHQGQPYLVMDLVDESVTFLVEWRDALPDTFTDEVEVVLEGRMRADGVFEATTMLTKCGSRYEAAPPEDPAA